MINYSIIVESKGMKIPFQITGQIKIQSIKKQLSYYKIHDMTRLRPTTKRSERRPQRNDNKQLTT